MSMNDHATQLQDATRRRTAIAAKVERLKGRLEEAEANLSSVEEECRSKKIEPEQLDEAINKLEQRFAKELETLQAAMKDAEAALEPFETGV